MSYGLVTHVAINVPDLVEAEAFYTEFFDTGIAFRQTPIDGEWHTLPSEVDWPTAEEAGYEPRMSFIQKDDLFLALQVPASSEHHQEDQSYHVGLEMSSAELEDILLRADELNCKILHQHDTGALIEDTLGYEWDIAVDWDTYRSATPSGPWIDI